MPKSRSLPRTAAARLAGKPRPFTFKAHTREQLALLLRLMKDVPRAREFIGALERRAREFVEVLPFAIVNSDSAVREAVQALRLSATRTQEVIRGLPPRARDAVIERLYLERGLPARTLNEARENMAALRWAALRVLSDLAPNPKGGRPVDHRGQRFAADLALIFSDIGGITNEHVEGNLAKILLVVFEAVGYPTGDMATLLKGIKLKLGDIPHQKI